VVFKGSFQAGAARGPSSHPSSPSAHPTSALVAGAQGGLTLGPDGGVLGAGFCSLGMHKLRNFYFRRHRLQFEVLQIDHFRTHISRMSSDEIVWQVINQQFCSFKLKYVLPSDSSARNQN
jgi:hypothetical protein